MVHQTTEGTKKEVLNVYLGILHQAIFPISNSYENHPSIPGNNLGAPLPASEVNQQMMIAQFLLLERIIFQSSMPQYMLEQAASR